MIIPMIIPAISGNYSERYVNMARAPLAVKA
jgi:hypothetical protein